MAKAVYIHIPFCEHICHYCDFNKVFLKGQPVEDYLSACAKEMKVALLNHPSSEITSVYVGGGTPTALTEKQLERHLGDVKQIFNLKKQLEFTVEVNPGNVSEEKFAVLKAAGVNRLSIGVQAFQEDLLKKIGRTHSEKDIYETIEKAKKSGFSNISIDLMFGLPGQTLQMFEETLNKAVKLDVTHFSAYSLKVEEKTVFAQLARKGQLQLPAEDVEVAMYNLLIDFLTASGFTHYEISNFAKNGFESKHNLTYWNNDEYFGIGAGAHGYLSGVRYGNIGPIKKYITSVEESGRGIVEQTVVTRNEKIEEEMFLGLRKLQGISIEKFEVKYGTSPLSMFHVEMEQLIQAGLIEVKDNYISLTRNGLFVSNEVFEKFLF